jgi:hypothetical protein
VASKYGLMALSMRGGGNTAKEMERGEKLMKTETSMTDTGRITKLMDPVHTSTTTAADIKETGKRTSSMVTAWKPGLMVLVTMVTMRRARNMDRVNIHGAMEAPTRESSARIKGRAKVLMITLEYLFHRNPSLE